MEQRDESGGEIWSQAAASRNSPAGPCSTTRLRERTMQFQKLHTRQWFDDTTLRVGGTENEVHQQIEEATKLTTEELGAQALDVAPKNVLLSMPKVRKRGRERSRGVESNWRRHLKEETLDWTGLEDLRGQEPRTAPSSKKACNSAKIMGGRMRSSGWKFAVQHGSEG